MTGMGHLHMVVNDWVGGQVTAVAKVAVESGAIKVESSHPEWVRLLNGPLRDPVTGASVSPDDPERYIEALKKRYSGTYVEATDVHEDEDCLFATADRLPMRRK